MLYMCVTPLYHGPNGNLHVQRSETHSKRHKPQATCCVSIMQERCMLQCLDEKHCVRLHRSAAFSVIYLSPVNVHSSVYLYGWLLCVPYSIYSRLPSDLFLFIAATFLYSARSATELFQVINYDKPTDTVIRERRKSYRRGRQWRHLKRRRHVVGLLSVNKKRRNMQKSEEKNSYDKVFRRPCSSSDAVSRTTART